MLIGISILLPTHRHAYEYPTQLHRFRRSALLCLSWRNAAENLVGNEYIIALRLKVDIGRAAETDEVADTVSYADVYEAVKEEMSIPSKLLEHVCGRIVGRLFADFPSVEEIEIKLSKRNPPMGADIDTAAIEMKCCRG